MTLRDGRFRAVLRGEGMITFLPIVTLLFIMATVTILLVKNWKKWAPILTKTAQISCFLIIIFVFFLVSYAIIKENWLSISRFFADNSAEIFSWVLVPIVIIFFIANYVGLYVLFNDWAPPADKLEEQGTRSAAIGWAAVIGGTLNFVLVGLFLEFGPFASAYDSLDHYSRASGFNDGLTVAATLAVSCWSLVPLIFVRVRRPKAVASAAAHDASE